MIDLGYYLLFLNCFLSCYAFFSAVVSFFKKDLKLQLLHSSRNALYLIFIILVIATLILVSSLMYHDFSLFYAYRNTSLDMPPWYLLTAFWSSLEGSHLLWYLILSGVIAFSLLTMSQAAKSELLPWLNLSYSSLLVFMSIVSVTVSNSFVKMLPPGSFGLGMNPLLQNPYMAIHPPLLFLGYSMLAVPFSYSFAIIMSNKKSLYWYSSLRAWILVSWIILTLAIFLGGKWAYIELGWGGYWAWDPVENSSFMPWLCLISAIHALLLIKHTMKYFKLCFLLLMMSFSLTFLGTFITRSGVISSVHSFAEGGVGPVYLVWVACLFFFSIYVVCFKGDAFLSKVKKPLNFLTKEFALLLSNYLFLFLLFIVFLGTLLPIVSEAIRGIRISIQEPFYNAFAPWVGISLAAALAISTLLKWRKLSIASLLFKLLFASLISMFLCLTLYFLSYIENKRLFLVFFVSIFSMVLLISESLYFGFLKKLKDNVFDFKKLGSFLVHFGFLIAILGFSGNYQSKVKNIFLKKNEDIEVFSYRIKNNGLGYKKEFNAQYIIAMLKVTTKDNSFLLYPSRSKYSTSDQWFNEVDIFSLWNHDLYIVLATFDVKTEAVSLQVYYNPYVSLVWLSLLFLAIGIIVSLLSFEKNNSFRVFSEKNSIFLKKLLKLISKKALGVFIIMSLFSSYNSSSYAKRIEDPFYGLKEEKRELAQKIARDLRCPTCQGLSLLESQTLQSKIMLDETISQVKKGKDEKEIKNFFIERYGEWILRQPNSESLFGKFVWYFPLLFLLLSVFILFIYRRAQKKQNPHFLNESLFEKIDAYVYKEKRKL